MEFRFRVALGRVCFFIIVRCSFRNESSIFNILKVFNLYLEKDISFGIVNSNYNNGC